MSVKRFGLAALVTVTIAAPVVANAQVDPLGLIPALKAAVPKAAAPVAPPGCGRSAMPWFPDVGPRPADYAPAILWPEPNQCVRGFRDLEFPAAKAQKKAFDTASRTPCDACEGGYNYESWANYYTEKDGSKSKFEAKLLALPIGKSITWKASKFTGEAVPTGNHAIGSTPCKQFHWTLRAGGKVAAEREGLYCEVGGRWVEII